MTSTVTSDAGIGLLQSKHFLGDTDIMSPECDWKFGYSTQRGNTSNFAGAPSQGPMQVRHTPNRHILPLVWTFPLGKG